MEKKLISIICPVFNEELTIPIFYRRLTLALADLRSKYNFELIFTNNGSTDRTLEILRELSEKDETIQALTFSRNFGYQSSLMAGLQHARGEAVMVVDSDCEDPPEMLPRLIAGWEQGYDLVYGIRRRKIEPLTLRFFRKAFYRLTRSIADYDFILDMAEFSLFTRRVRHVVLSNHSTYPFIRAELGFAGFKRLGIPYERERRAAGKTHYNYFGMFQFAFGGILSSSTFFLRLALYIGLPLVALNLGWVATSLFVDLGNKTQLVLLLDASFLIFALGFVAAYVARIYKDSVGRPLYVIDRESSILRAPLSAAAESYTYPSREAWMRNMPSEAPMEPQ